MNKDLEKKTAGFVQTSYGKCGENNRDNWIRTILESSQISKINQNTKLKITTRNRCSYWLGGGLAQVEQESKYFLTVSSGLLCTIVFQNKRRDGINNLNKFCTNNSRTSKTLKSRRRV